MNWETTKNWLMAAFLILDLLLGWQLLQSRDEISGYVESPSDLLANTKTLLANHGFSLDATVPEAEPNLSSIRGDVPQISLQTLSQIAFPRANSVIIYPGAGATTRGGQVKLLGDGGWQVNYNHPVHLFGGDPSAWLQRVWRGDSYVLDATEKQAGSLTFVGKYQSYPVFDVQVVVFTQADNMLGYVQSAAVNWTPVGGGKPVISALDALDSLANAVDKPGFHQDNKVLKIDLGYARKIPVNSIESPFSGASYWFPVWRVVTTFQTYYINAFTGEVDTSP